MSVKNIVDTIDDEIQSVVEAAMKLDHMYSSKSEHIIALANAIGKLKVKVQKLISINREQTHLFDKFISQQSDSDMKTKLKLAIDDVQPFAEE